MRALRSFLTSTAVLGLAALVAQPAFAQEVDLDQDGETVEGTAEEGAVILVTGSRIARPNLDTPVPVTAVSLETLQATGQTTIGDVLNELPSLRSTYSSANSTRFIGTSGLSLLDLRGLGTSRTLVLQNGRRLVPGLIGESAPDVNMIPTDLIDRVEIVTGGSSAVYGSDAIAGVVNFILKDDYEGIQLRARGGISSRGDAGSYLVSGIAGQNFADDRGNITVAAEYARQDRFRPNGRGDMAVNSDFVIVDSDPTGLKNGSDGNPDRIYFRDLTFTTISDFGMITPSCSDSTPADVREVRCLPGGNVPRLYGFDPQGNLVQDPYIKDFRPLANRVIGGIGSNLRSPQDIDLRPEIERVNLNLLAHFTVSDAFVPFVEGQFSHVTTAGGQGGPSFFQGGVLGTLRIDNPFLNDQARAIIQDFAGPGATTFQLSRNNRDLGNRDYPATRDTFRVVGGVRGDFNDDWNYEISANYGQFKEVFRPNGQFDRQRLAYALDAVRDSAGNIVCRVTVDPTARVVRGFASGTDQATLDAAQARIDSDVAACVPFNPFGAQNSQAAIAYVAPQLETRSKQTQFVLNGFMSGDTSDWFELPGGPVGFAIGGEYRKETAYRFYDDVTVSGGNFLNAIPDFDPPSFAVKEAFGEIRIPILADQPFFHELTIEGAGRVADYRGSTGTVFAWNASATWAPVRDFRVRGSYSRAVRAPNLSELYDSQTQNFSSGFQDPCSATNIGAGTASRAANCAADGVPAGTILNYTSSLEILSGGNPDLFEESSESYTIGAVFTPRFLPGFSLSADYYDIFVDNVITAPTAQAIVNACYDAADLNNRFCQLFDRFPAGTVGDTPQLSEYFVKTGLQQTQLNYAGLAARGIDIEAAYSHKFNNFGRLGGRFTATYVLQRDQYLFPDEPDRPDQILYETGDPRFAFNFALDYESGPVSVGYQMRYIGKQLIVGNDAENVFSVGGRPPQNADYSQFNWFSDVMYHDIRVGIKPDEKFEFTLGVENIFDRLPEFGNTGVGVGSAIFDNRGRYFYAGVTANF